MRPALPLGNPAGRIGRIPEAIGAGRSGKFRMTRIQNRHRPRRRPVRSVEAFDRMNCSDELTTAGLVPDAAAPATRADRSAE
jgi:hypothetical protein